MTRKHKTAWSKILDFLKKHKRLAYNSREIAKAVKLPAEHVRVVIRHMFDKGAIDARLYQSDKVFGKRQIMYFKYKSFEEKLEEETNTRVNEISEFLIWLGNHPEDIRNIIKVSDLHERRNIQKMMRRYHKMGITKIRRKRK